MPEITSAQHRGTIGGRERVYGAFAPLRHPTLDGPSTMTLHASTLDACQAWPPIHHSRPHDQQDARTNRADRNMRTTWHRATYRAEHCLCAPADPVLVRLRTLQFWLWQRLQAPYPPRGPRVNTLVLNSTPSTTAREARELFRRSRHESRRHDHSKRQADPARQTRRCRAAFHRRGSSPACSTGQSIGVPVSPSPYDPSAWRGHGERLPEGIGAVRRLNRTSASHRIRRAPTLRSRGGRTTRHAATCRRANLQERRSMCAC